MRRPFMKHNGAKASDKYYQKVAKYYVELENGNISMGQFIKKIEIGNASNLCHILDNDRVQYYIHNFRWLGHCGHNLSTCYIECPKYDIHEKNNLLE